MRFIASACAIALMAGVATSANAGLINEYNLIVTGNMSITSEVEGRTYVGGNLTGGGTFGGALTPSSAYSNVDVLQVGGNINVSNINMNAGDLRRTGTRSGGVNLNGVGSQEFVDGTPLAMRNSFINVLSSTSAMLSGLAANSTVTLPTSQPAPATFNAVPDAFGRAVFSINASMFSNSLVQQINLNLNGATSMVINVTGGSVNFNGGNFVGSWLSAAVRATTIWNFANATTMQIDRNFHGAILAPNATLTNTTSIDGSVFVANFNGNGEVHLPNYSAPAPGAVAVAGIAGLFASRRRRAA